MPATYTTPGVYVEEISTFPPSVAEVSTAVPAFLGHTAGGPPLKPTRITTLMEYEQVFGGAPDVVTGATVAPDGSVTAGVAVDPALLYYSLRLYFDNGGGPCYIVSIGGHGTARALDDFKKGLQALQREDEPTLIVMPDATRLSAADYGVACGAALDHCGSMRDRFAILDLKAGQKSDDFRSAVSSDYLSYGAVYTPYLGTALAPSYREGQVVVTGVPNPTPPPAGPVEATFDGTVGGLKVTYTGAPGDTPKVEILVGQPALAITIKEPGPVLSLALDDPAKKTATEVLAKWTELVDKGGFVVVKTAAVDVTAAAATALAKKPAPAPAGGGVLKLDALAEARTGVYNVIKAALGRQRLTLPASGAIAGIYARVDRDRGVWKAPANVAVASVIRLTETLTDEEQGRLNVDPTSGKSINAIRAFVGRGVLVWGARTLAGNDNEWRYVPVRRLFIMIEESTKKATTFAVFEPNVAGTWLKVKAMIESFLYSLWERGALAGSKPESAYYVNVGLGTTMTAQDILEGRMIVEIGVAAVRPAEFIVLRFTHKMQEA